LDAEKTGRSPRTGLVLSSRRCTRRLLRLRRCRILAFTRNPFLLVVMMRCYFIQHRRNSKGFRVFQKNSKQKCDTFAWLRIRYNHLKGAEILHRPKGLQKYSLRSTVPFVSSPCLRLVFASDLLASF